MFILRKQNNQITVSIYWFLANIFFIMKWHCNDSTQKSLWSYIIITVISVEILSDVSFVLIKNEILLLKFEASFRNNKQSTFQYREI